MLSRVQGEQICTQVRNEQRKILITGLLVYSRTFNEASGISTVGHRSSLCQQTFHLRHSTHRLSLSLTVTSLMLYLPRCFPPEHSSGKILLLLQNSNQIFFSLAFLDPVLLGKKKVLLFQVSLSNINQTSPYRSQLYSNTQTIICFSSLSFFMIFFKDTTYM